MNRSSAQIYKFVTSRNGYEANISRSCIVHSAYNISEMDSAYNFY